MTQRKHTPSYTAEFRARGVRLFNEQRSEYRSDNAAYQGLCLESGGNSPATFSKFDDLRLIRRRGQGA